MRIDDFKRNEKSQSKKLQLLKQSALIIANKHLLDPINIIFILFFIIYTFLSYNYSFSSIYNKFSKGYVVGMFGKLREGKND